MELTRKGSSMVRQWHSNDGEALVAGDGVPAALQLEDGRGECEAGLQWGTMVARAELTGRTGRWWHCSQNLAARGVSGRPEWMEGRGERGCARTVLEASMWKGKKKGGGRDSADVFYQCA
jgi:hypothetical protein